MKSVSKVQRLVILKHFGMCGRHFAVKGTLHIIWVELTTRSEEICYDVAYFEWAWRRVNIAVNAPMDTVCQKSVIIEVLWRFQCI